MPRKSVHAVARDFSAYAVEHLMRELRDDPRARLAATQRLGLTTADGEDIVRQFFTQATVYLDADGEIRIALPKPRRRDR